MADHTLQNAGVNARRIGQHWVVKDLAWFAKCQPCECWRQGQGHHQGAHQGGAHHIGHGREQLVLDALKRQQRHVGADDHRHAKEDGARDLQGGINRILHGQRPVGVLFALAQNVLDQYHRTIHQDAKVDSAQRQQVCRYLEVVHEDERHQERHRNRQRHNGRSARAAQKQQQHDGHQGDAFGQRHAHRVQGGIDERGAVQVRHHLHALGQQVAVEVVHRSMDTLQGFRRVVVLEQQGDAFDGVRVVVFAQNAAPLHIAVGQLAQVFDKHGHAVFDLDDHVAHVVQRAQQPYAAHHIALLPTVHHAAAAVGVVLVDGRFDITQREAILGQTIRVQLQHELGGQAPKIGHIDNAGHLFEARNHRPKLQVRQLAQGMRFGFERVAVNLARGRCIGVQTRHRAIRQRHLGHLLLQALARKIALGAVVKHHGDER